MNEEKSTRYHRAKRRDKALALAWSVVLLSGWLWSGASVWLRAGLESAAGASADGSSGWLVVVAYVAVLVLVHEIGALPIAFHDGVVLETRYGLSTEPPRVWLRDRIRALGLVTVAAMVAAGIAYACIRAVPDAWWLPAGVVFSLLTVGLATLGPVLVLPLFFDLTPLRQDSLRQRLLALADRAGARAVDVYEWRLGPKTRKANAALTGLGATRRILVSDTMLEGYTEDEIEVVLAHELAHHVHGDIWKGLAVESGLILVSVLAAAHALAPAVTSLGLTGTADVAGLPLVLLAAGGVLVATRPLTHAVSRAHERRADGFALTLTRNPDAFASAMRRLSAQNLAEEEPSRLATWLFYSHPPVRERIAVARAFSA